MKTKYTFFTKDGFFFHTEEITYNSKNELNKKILDKIKKLQEEWEVDHVDYKAINQ